MILLQRLSTIQVVSLLLLGTWLSTISTNDNYVVSGESPTTTSLADLQRDSPMVTIPQDFWVPQSLTSTPEWKTMKWKDVEGCCGVESSSSNNKKPNEEPTCSIATLPPDVTMHRKVIGRLPQFTTQSTEHVLEQAVQAWNGGMGTWTQMTLEARIQAIRQVFEELKQRREDIVQVLMWEIGKNKPDAESEFDRTVQFAMSVIDVIENNNDKNNDSDDIAAESWQSIGSTQAFIRRAALGVILCLGPYNYPINETYATLIPALLMGNICILKIPSVGGLAHLLTLEAFAKVLPTATVNFVSGPGASTVPPLMKSGKIDGLAFIGGSDVADTLIQDHPHPHRLKVFLQLEAKNMAIYLPDLFGNNGGKDDDMPSPLLDNALQQAIIGSLSYNGQRCTALKLHMVPTRYAEYFATKLAERVETMTVGLPWQQFGPDQKYSQVTPLPNRKRISYMKELLEDALAKGAKIINRDGGKVIGDENNSSTLMVPAVVYPVTSDMRLFHEEQFGPLLPVSAYDDLSTILEMGRTGIYAQQVSIFGSDAELIGPMINAFSAIFGKINLNSQCGRSPDTIPFSGRRSSAMGVMSVKDALREFSTPTVISYKTLSDPKPNQQQQTMVDALDRSVNFLQPVKSDSGRGGSKASK